ncbi:hypothetical protein FQV07_0014790, partial [Pygoscelis papua]
LEPRKLRGDCPNCGKGTKRENEFPCYECWKEFNVIAVPCICHLPRSRNKKCPSHPYLCLYVFSGTEKEKLMKLGAKQRGEQWILEDGREVIPKLTAIKIMNRLPDVTHWGTQALVDQFATKYSCTGAYNIAKRIVEECLTCQKVNK